jgi:hypothetical protein
MQGSIKKAAMPSRARRRALSGRITKAQAKREPTSAALGERRSQSCDIPEERKKSEFVEGAETGHAVEALGFPVHSKFDDM